STPASILNHKTDKSGIPFDSVKGGTALAIAAIASKDHSEICGIRCLFVLGERVNMRAVTPRRECRE
ncbi:hypothetical protein NKI39_30965, partial [Mesorhizobium sp. M0664]|uniref:hypothetical protein n=1 Tax=Mesorhizobium sp. M0664 TaxID=2956982 RepID=UPI00333D4DE5